jgi:hypothetical protein
MSATRIRAALREISPAAAHQASTPPKPGDVYPPLEHGTALHFDRSLVIGNRGVGKSFWASVLADDGARAQAAKLYGQAQLERTRVVLGFHEAAEADEGPAPSRRVLHALLNKGFPADLIWRTILLNGLAPVLGDGFPHSFDELAAWCSDDVERMENVLRGADTTLHREEGRLLIVFDALDRLAEQWKDVRALTSSLLRFALDLRGFRAIRAKLFLRSDQWSDESLFQFADASKLRSERVELVWTQRDLYGLVYQYLWEHADAGEDFRRLVTETAGGQPTLSGVDAGERLLETLRRDAELQERVFVRLAGQFMGSNHRRGRTYNWLHDHLADAARQTSPRSFQIALKSAADLVSESSPLALDHSAIKSGVVAASRVRVEQLNEDYPWMKIALEALEDLEVPTEREAFVRRWRERGTVQRVLEAAGEREVDAPVSFASPGTRNEDGLLASLRGIGVIEVRSESRINVPDIFRVAAKLKRRGGVRVPGRQRTS